MTNTWLINNVFTSPVPQHDAHTTPLDSWHCNQRSKSLTVSPRCVQIAQFLSRLINKKPPDHLALLAATDFSALWWRIRNILNDVLLMINQPWHENVFLQTGSPCFLSQSSLCFYPTDPPSSLAQLHPLTEMKVFRVHNREKSSGRPSALSLPADVLFYQMWARLWNKTVSKMSNCRWCCHVNLLNLH